MPTRNTDRTGTVGSGTALRLWAKSVQSCRPMTMPSGIPTMMPTTAATVAWPGDRGNQLSRGESERFQQGQVASASADRRNQGEGERDDRPGGEPYGEDDRGRADAAVVHDLGWPLHTQDGDVVAASVGVGTENPICDIGDALHVGLAQPWR